MTNHENTSFVCTQAPGRETLYRRPSSIFILWEQPQHMAYLTLYAALQDGQETVRADFGGDVPGERRARVGELPFGAVGEPHLECFRGVEILSL
eukprot:4033266-Amphidinium_carterae.1